MNPSQEQYEETLAVVHEQFRYARQLNRDARLEWYQEVKKLLQREMEVSDFPINDEDVF